jgi:hypothetical protein
MNIHHNTSFKSILEDDSISLASKAHICFCSVKGTKLWLIVRPSIHSFCITHSTFTLALCFHLNLIQPLASCLLTCECGHGLDVSGMHLAHCPFRGQRIATHDAHQGRHVCPHSNKWAHCMEKKMLQHYVMSFITNQFLHHSWRLGFYCWCGGY